jgi:uncharacterized metal-binding protein
MWLSLLGNPTAVNPDLNLYRQAQKERWNVLDWVRRPAAGAVARTGTTGANASVKEGAGTA